MAATTVAPSGAQHELRSSGSHAWVAEVGATLRHLTLDGLEVLDGFEVGERAPAGAGQLLLPWPNRVRDGRYPWEGGHQQLVLSEPENANAIHGLTRWSAWSLVDRDAASVTLAHRLHPQPGWPAVLDLTATYRLGPEGLTVALGARNPDDRAAPFGAGAHPYLRLDTAGVDDLTLTVPAATRLTTDNRSLPTGAEAVAGSAGDFRAPRRIGPAVLDTAFTDLERDGSGRWEVVLGSPSGRKLALWAGPAFSHVMVFTGDTVGGPRRRRALAVEPMTCPPDAFNRPGSFTVLAPGESWVGEFGISLSH